MGMEEELGSLQPWQIFSALYLGFWSLSAYFDHFLMTFVFCLAFGVMSEIATRYMNGDHLASGSPASQKELQVAMQAVSRVEEHSEPIPQKLECVYAHSKEDLKEEIIIADDEGPPPLPAKDYLPEPDEIMPTSTEETNYIDEFSEASKEASPQPPTPHSYLDDLSAEPSKEPSPAPQSSSPNLLDDLSPSPSTLVKPADSTKNDLEDFLSDRQTADSTNSADISQSADFMRKSAEPDVEVVGGIEDAMNDEDDVMEMGRQPVMDLGRHEKKDEGKLYAPDSSSDEELEAEYANREVNLEESESEEENGGYEFTRGNQQQQENGAKHGISLGLDDSSPEEGPAEHLSSEDSSPTTHSADDDLRTSVVAAGAYNLLDNNSQVSSSGMTNKDSEMEKSGADGANAALLGAEGLKAALSATDDSTKSTHSNSEIDDIDLTDPNLELAATKIQSVFKGFQARKKLSKL